MIQRDSTLRIELHSGSSPRLALPENKAVEIVYSKDFFAEHGMFQWVRDFKLGTAGYRDTINMDDFFSTDAPYNAHTIMLVAEAMARIYNERHYRSLHIGGEVRRFTPEIIQYLSRIFAAHGIDVFLNSEKETTPIWASSFGIFYHELDGGANITASHSQNFKQGFKPLDEHGMQLLDMAEIIRKEVSNIGEGVHVRPFSIHLAPSSSIHIKRDFHYLVPYTDYVKGIIPVEAQQAIRKAQSLGMKVGVSTLGGSMHENSRPIFESLDISTGPGGMIQYMHWEKRDDFHSVGEIDGENYGCDPTKPVIYKNIGLKEKLIAQEIVFGFIWDPDGDRYNMVTMADEDLANKAESIGLEVERVKRSPSCIVYFRPNQIYFLNTVLKLEMMARTGELFEYDFIIGTTYPTSRSISELAEIFNRKYASSFRKEGTKLRVFRTPVGFKYFGNMVRSIEDQLLSGKEVVLTSSTGKKIGLGKKTRILIMAEESGGATLGSSEWIFNHTGSKCSLALKEKDAMQIALLNLGVMAQLFLAKGSFAQLYIDKIEEYDIQYRYYDRIDKKLFDESLTGEARERAKSVGNGAKDFMVKAFRALAEKPSISEAQQALGQLMGKGVVAPKIEEIFWAGDGTYIDFGAFWFELRASGTDAVLRFYIEGKEKAQLNAVNEAFVALAEAKIEALAKEKGYEL
jgi:phosphomannomutase